jgi:hypothetical protein
MTRSPLIRKRPWSVVFALVLALGLVSAASAAGPGSWTILSEGAGAPSASRDPGLFRTSDGLLHVGWVYANGPLNEDLLHRTVSPAGALGAVTPIVRGWTGIADPAFLSESGGLRVFYGGQSSTTAGAMIGLITATGPLSGASWSPPTLASDRNASTVSAARAGDGTPLQTFESSSTVAVHRGLSPSPLSIFASGVTDGSSNIVTDAGGAVWLAWCAFGPNAGGIYVAPVNPATGGPAGAATALPGSLTAYQGVNYSTCVLQTEISRRIPLVARAGGGVFVAGSAGYPTLSSVNVWRVGGGTIVAANAPKLTHSEPQLAAAPDGRIWVAWVEKGGIAAPAIVARRSNRAASTFGAPVRLRPPSPWSLGTFELSAQADRVDVLAQLGRVDGTQSLQQTQLLPGLTLVKQSVARRKRGRAAVTLAVLDAGDPVAGARVSAGGKSAATKASGRATIVLAAKPSRTIRATASRAGYVGAAASFRCC